VLQSHCFMPIGTIHHGTELLSTCHAVEVRNDPCE
jgi:hypothetical protein